MELAPAGALLIFDIYTIFPLTRCANTACPLTRLIMFGSHPHLFVTKDLTVKCFSLLKNAVDRSCRVIEVASHLCQVGESV